MVNVFIEVTNGPQNWGKFMVARFDEEWKRKSVVVEKDIGPGWGLNWPTLADNQRRSKIADIAQTRINID